MTAALGGLHRAGDVVVTESLTYPGLRRLADFLRVRLHGVAMDESGIDPEAFETACRNAEPQGLSTASPTCRTRRPWSCRPSAGADRRDLPALRREDRRG
jgi:DNA-binding transcriptional MocR family regulator